MASAAGLEEAKAEAARGARCWLCGTSHRSRTKRLIIPRQIFRGFDDDDDDIVVAYSSC